MHYKTNFDDFVNYEPLYKVQPSHSDLVDVML